MRIAVAAILGLGIISAHADDELEFAPASRNRLAVVKLDDRNTWKK